MSEFSELVTDLLRKEIRSLSMVNPTASKTKLYTTKELSELIGIAPITIHKLKKKGILKGIYIGRSVRYAEEDVEALFKHNK